MYLLQTCTIAHSGVHALIEMHPYTQKSVLQFELYTTTLALYPVSSYQCTDLRRDAQH
jgi:hypothetical protein